MNEKEIYSFLYMLYELKQGVVLYDLKYDFTDDLTNAKVGYVLDKGTDNEHTLYNVINYHPSNIDVTIVAVNDSDLILERVPIIDLCYMFDIYSIPTLKSVTKDIVERINYMRAMVKYFDEHTEDVRMLKMFEDNNRIVDKIANKPNFKLSDVQPLIDLITI
jgi:hypothetical protein